MSVEKIKENYIEKEKEIRNRIKSFEDLKKSASEERLFLELVFVILTSRSEAQECWKAARKLKTNNILISGNKKEIQDILENYKIQDEMNKSKYIVENRKMFSQPSLTDPTTGLKIRDKINSNNIESTRKWFVENVKGISWKGSSHFLRNIGFGLDFAVISKPLMRQLYLYNKVESSDLPKNQEEYLEVESNFREFAEECELDIASLDLTLWYMETGEVFK